MADEYIIQSAPAYIIQSAPAQQTFRSGESIMLGTGSFIRSGQTDYDTGVGFWLGNHNDTPKFSIGDSAGDNLTWNGTSLDITGVLTATSGTIGGFTIGATTITATNLTLDSSGQRISLGSANNIVILDADDATYRLWVGNSTAASAPFRVEADGGLVASDATITGTITSSAGTIGGFTLSAGALTATNLAISSSGQSITLGSSNDIIILDADDATYRLWVGNATAASAPFRVTKAGVVTATNITITGGSVATSVLNGLIAQATLNVANRGWVQTSVFSVTDADTVAWGAGTFTASDGTAYSIGAGNTGNMAAKTYIYLDIGVSTTAYQTTTTATTAVGSGKVLIAIAQNGTGEATFTVMGGQGGQNIDASSIVAGSITANELAASSVTAGKIFVSALSAISADLGAITAGTIVLPSGGFIRSGQTAYDTGTGFYLGNDLGTPKLSIGNSGGSKLTWDGSALSITGALTATSLSVTTGNILLDGTGDSFITTNTSDGSDTRTVLLSGGGGGSGTGTTRGANLFLAGNESASIPGGIILRSGNVTGSSILIENSLGGNITLGDNTLALNGFSGGITIEATSIVWTDPSHSGGTHTFTQGVTVNNNFVVTGTVTPRLVNTLDSSSLQGVRIESDRATPTVDDVVYASFMISDSAGNQDEFVRLAARAQDVTSTSEDGRLDIAVMIAGTLTTKYNFAGTAFQPQANDGAALGTTALGWSDLHLATGALINVANGNAVITHSSGVFTVSTGDFRITTAGTNAASAVTVQGTQTLTNKTLTSPVLTTPQINDTTADHQYVFAVNELAADRTVTLPLLAGNDTFVFEAFSQTLTNKTLALGSNTVSGTLAQFNTAVTDADFVSIAGVETLTNKTLTSPVLTTPQINDTSADHQYVFAVSELAADRTVTLPLLTGNDEFVFKDFTQTLTNKTLTTPVFSGTPTGTVTSGTYTPTLTNVTNVAASTAFTAQYMRVGNVVTVSGKVNIDPTAAAATRLEMSLPIASNFSAEEQLGGTAFCQAVQQGAAIIADGTDDRAAIVFLANDTANRGWAFTFTYQII